METRDSVAHTTRATAASIAATYTRKKLNNVPNSAGPGFFLSPETSTVDCHVANSVPLFR